ncbi:MAG: GDP-mannose 4,6-dehydratase [Candidatus Hydrogenedentes bacterium]|nr:GDP-mannose 4,6-dehydratase [Candidatus Hydrogenedentota bacterium]
MSKVALVTGASGFAGSYLSEYLKSQGWDVRRAVNPDAAEDVDAFPCDITDADRVRRLVKWACDATHVFHLAAVTFVPFSSRNPADTMAVNVEGTILLASALREVNAAARMVFVGSAAVYGIPESLPITESHRISPREPYAISKAAADAYCEYLSRGENVDIVRARPFNHSGPGQPETFVLSSFAKQIADIEAGRAEPVIHVGNIDTARDFLHVSDVVRAYELLALKGVVGEAYNICSGRAHTVRDALDMLLGQSKASISVRVDPDRLRAVDIPVVYGSHERLTQCTGWTPSVTFEEMLMDLLAYWRREGCAPGKAL